MRCGEADTLILGIGNPMRGDDGFAFAVVRALEVRLDPRGVDLRHAHQLLPELADPISRAARVLFIDAEVGPPPGRLRRRRLRADAERAGAPTMHQFSPQRLLGLAETLYGRRPPAVLYTAGAACLDVSAVLTPSVRAACELLVQRVAALCERLAARREEVTSA